MKQNDKANLFLHYWNLLAPEDLPKPIPEYHFYPGRQWRFDWCWPEIRCRVAVEVDGGIWMNRGGRHGSDTDRDKMNHAAAAGWRVLHFSPGMLETDPQSCVELVVKALGIL
jgi:hypothetical protein